MKAILVVGLVASAGWAQSSVELTLVPVAVQLNGKYTQHAGTFGAITWHPRDRLGVQLVGGGNWYNEESAFNVELVEKYRVEAQVASSLLWTWGVFGGFEVEPFVGEFTFLEGTSARLGFVMSVAAGAGSTRHQLKPQTDTPATYADTGVRFMGTSSAGLRLQLAKRVTFRLEVRDVMFSAHVEGCGRSLRPRDPFLIRGSERPGVEVCNPLFETTTSELVHNATLSLGVCWVF